MTIIVELFTAAVIVMLSLAGFIMSVVALIRRTLLCSETPTEAQELWPQPELDFWIENNKLYQ